MSTTFPPSTVQTYLRIIQARWRWVAWGAIAAVALTAAVLFLLPPLYRTNATVFIRTPGDISQSMDGGDLYAQSRAETYAALAKSTGVASRVVADMGLNLPPEKLARRVQAHHIGRTALFQVKVSAPSADEAKRTAEVLLHELSVDAATLEAVPGGLLPRAELVVVDPPTRPTRLFALGAPVSLVLVAATIGGVFFGALGAVVGSRRFEAPEPTTKLEDV